MLRLVEISDRACRLSLEEACLVVADRCDVVLQRVPLDEMDVLILENPASSISGALLAQLGRERVTLVCCDEKHQPTASMLPVFGGALSHRKTLEGQFNMSESCRKRLWQQIIMAKIRGQDAVLKKYRGSNALKGLAGKVFSGDSTNMEAQAALIYWKELDLFPVRARYTEDANAFFNYAYTVLYATTARFICSAALHPLLGIKHKNPHNTFCLASDIMEMYRPFMDDMIMEMIQYDTAEQQLTFREKRVICNSMTDKKISMDGKLYRLQEALRNTVLSFRKCVEKNLWKLLLVPDYDSI